MGKIQRDSVLCPAEKTKTAHSKGAHREADWGPGGQNAMSLDF